MIRSLAVLLLLLLLGVSPVQAQHDYNEGLAWKLISHDEVQRVTRCSERLNHELKQAPAILTPSDAPLGGIDPLEDDPDRIEKTPNQWTLPPFPLVAPAIPFDLPEEVRAQWEADEAKRRQAVEVPEAFPGVLPEGSENAPSVRLRPRKIKRKDAMLTRNFEIPEPFSMRRYSGSSSGPFFQISLYGGTWYTAERAFTSLKAAAPDRKKLEGIGKDAFLLRILEREEAPAMAEEKAPEVPLGGVDVAGKERPDLFDVPALTAQNAPVWQDVPTKINYVKRPQFRPVPKKYVDRRGKLEKDLLLMVAYFPEQALTVELALDRRLGTMQDLVQLSMSLNKKVKAQL